MRISALTTTLLLAAAAGCARTSADRSTRHHDDDAARDRPVTGKNPDERAGDRNSSAAPTRLELTGVAFDPTIASACGIALPPTTYFEFDSAALGPDDNVNLRDLAACVSNGPLYGRRIELVGHTDPRGTDEYNQRLGRSRAESVREYMVSIGVAPTHVVVTSMGEQQADTDDITDWPHERRVDVRLLPP